MEVVQPVVEALHVPLHAIHALVDSVHAVIDPVHALVDPVHAVAEISSQFPQVALGRQVTRVGRQILHQRGGMIVSDHLLQPIIQSLPSPFLRCHLSTSCSGPLRGLRMTGG